MKRGNNSIMRLPKIIISTIVFIIIWFVFFKLKLMWDKKQPLRNIGKRIENQDQKTFNIFGKNVRAGEVVEEKNEDEPEEIDPLTEAMKKDGMVEPKPKPKKSTKKKVVKKAVKKTTKKKR